jgi:hypothetical protein
MYLVPGVMAVAVRSFATLGAYQKTSPTLPQSAKWDEEPRKSRRRFPNPFFILVFILLLGVALLPSQPWQHLSATLLYDVLKSLTSVAIDHHLKGYVPPSSDGRLGTNLMGQFNYNPADDPYYIYNLDRPVDDFIASALAGTHFTNVFHIVLESMREDSFPWNEEGLLHQHIVQNEEPAEDGIAVTTENITPFISSLAEHTVSWHTTWASIPYTHKAMLGRSPRSSPLLTLDYCGMLPIPQDFGIELVAPAKFYQTCLPEAFRLINTVTDISHEIFDAASDNRSATTDSWETAHIQSMTTDWESELQALKRFGFSSVFDGENIAKLNPGKEFGHAFGFFDEGIARKISFG